MHGKLLMSKKNMLCHNIKQYDFMYFQNKFTLLKLVRKYQILYIF
jgi:hypothetical protein